MPAPRLLPEISVLEQLVSQEWTYKQIGQHYGVGEQAVYRQLRDAEKTRVQASYAAYIPWRVLPPHARATPLRNLRLVGRRDMKLPINDDEAARLDKWIAKLLADDLVVGYDPNLKDPTSACEHGGWFYSHRREEDGPPGTLITRRTVTEKK